jgi:molecular chaperone DnaK
MAYQAEKQLKENGGKLDAATKGKAEAAIADLKKAMDGDSADTLKAAIAAFEQAMQAMSASMAGAAGGGPADAGAAAGAATGKGGDEDIKDADFEVK